MKKIIISAFVVIFIAISCVVPTMDHLYAKENSHITTYDRIQYIQILIHFRYLEKQLEAVNFERNNYPEDSQEYKQLSEQLNHILAQEVYYEKKLNTLNSK
ncbi:hypothetical protein JOE49_003971 [Paenibacillus sp. PvR133]|jgi:hypothetical protein|uniref:hypothetical protein n=1 Tax=Paenibacillus sp. PvR133 TaxID=2806598 RepID=UPI001AE801D0|nr:hypothetical protein [Paenibacillus sp. PvR133]MBP1176719.1 hypothetical protein [Paenibacillus sp. PvR133]